MFAKALEFSNGRIFDAINMIAEVTKTLIRPDAATLGQSSIEEWCDKLRHKMADELSDFLPFEDLPVAETKSVDREGTLSTNFEASLVGRLGEIYHFWEIIKLTQFFTPEMVRTMTMGEYVLHLPQQGHAKMLSDMRVVSDLYDVEDLFKKESLRSST